MILVLLVWLQVIRDADTDAHLSPATATRQVYSPMLFSSELGASYRCIGSVRYTTMSRHGTVPLLLSTSALCCLHSFQFFPHVDIDYVRQYPCHRPAMAVQQRQP
jgi:hypothetical protein